MIQKKTGRPRAFDQDKAIEAALQVFWKKGYDGASMKDLTRAMGVNSPSLYAVFGDKRQLYLTTIDYYLNDDACAPLVAFESESDIGKAVTAFMRAAIDYATCHPSGAKGCFLASCVATTVESVAGTQERLQQGITGADERLAHRFEQEKELGHLPAGFPSLQRARLLFDLRQGHVLRARAGLSRQTMDDDLLWRTRMVLSDD